MSYRPDIQKKVGCHIKIRKCKITPEFVRNPDDLARPLYQSLKRPLCSCVSITSPDDRKRESLRDIITTMLRVANCVAD